MVRSRLDEPSGPGATWDLGERTFKVRPDAFFVRHDGGVWLRNNHGSFSLKGERSYELVNALFALLDGGRSNAEICARFPTATGDAVRHLIATLLRRGFVKELHDAPEPVADWMSELYPEHLAFLEYWSSAPVARLRDVRSQAVACLGDGQLLMALAGALADLGLARVRLFASDADAVREVAAAAGARDAGLDWVVTETSAERGLESLAGEAEIREARCVLIATGSEDQRSVAAAELVARERGQLAGVLGYAGGLVVASPLADRASEWCWECLCRSIVSPPAPDVPIASTPAAAGALHLAQRVFCRFAGIAEAEDHWFTSVDLMTPTVRSHIPRRHVLCRRHGAMAPRGRTCAGDVEPLRPNVPGPLDADDVVAAQDRIVAAVSSWTDPVAGPLGGVAAGARQQRPLSASSCTLRTPASAAGAPDTRLFECMALAPREARNQVVLFALEWLAGETARLRHEPREDVVYGAGWSHAEALYRALARLSEASAAEPSGVSTAPARPRDGDRGNVREFLVEMLRERGHGWRRTSAQTLSTGLVRVRLHMEDRHSWSGVGLDRDHAIDNALLRAAASPVTQAGAGRVAAAHVLPAARSWREAIAPLLEREPDRVGRDAGELLPFLAGHAALVALTPPTGRS
jgi:hypothetical protein